MSVLTKEHQDILRRHLKATGHQVLRDFFDTIDARDAEIAALREAVLAEAQLWQNNRLTGRGDSWFEKRLAVLRQANEGRLGGRETEV